MAKGKKAPKEKRVTPIRRKTVQAATPEYKAICHTKCYWLDTLWNPGDVYIGPAKPCHHFSKDGKRPNEDPLLMAAGDDPRSTKEMLTVLKRKYGVEPPVDEDGLPAKRQVVFQLLRRHEVAASGEGGIKAKQ
jgi:hypothetical protein